MTHETALGILFKRIKGMKRGQAAFSLDISLSTLNSTLAGRETIGKTLAGKLGLELVPTYRKIPVKECK